VYAVAQVVQNCWPLLGKLNNKCKLFSSRAALRHAEEEHGIIIKLWHYYIVILWHYYIVALQHCHIVALLHCDITKVLNCGSAATICGIASSFYILWHRCYILRHNFTFGESICFPQKSSIRATCIWKLPTNSLSNTFSFLENICVQCECKYFFLWIFNSYSQKWKAAKRRSTLVLSSPNLWPVNKIVEQISWELVKKYTPDQAFCQRRFFYAVLFSFNSPRCWHQKM